MCTLAFIKGASQLNSFETERRQYLYLHNFILNRCNFFPFISRKLNCCWLTEGNV